MEMHELRKRIDELVFETEQIQINDAPCRDSNRCLELVKTKLQEAKMWSGKVLEAKGNILPKGTRDYCEKRENEIPDERKEN